MAWVSKSFVDETLWPEFTQLNEVLSSYLEATTERVIRQGVHEDGTEAAVRKALPEG